MDEGLKSLMEDIERYRELLLRSKAQILKWADFYGRCDPKLLPPNGDIVLLDDIESAIEIQSDSKIYKASAKIESLEYDNAYLLSL